MLLWEYNSFPLIDTYNIILWLLNEFQKYILSLVIRISKFLGACVVVTTQKFRVLLFRTMCIHNSARRTQQFTEKIIVRQRRDLKIMQTHFPPTCLPVNFYGGGNGCFVGENRMQSAVLSFMIQFYTLLL